MAIITVTRQDAINVLKEEMYLDEQYLFKEISNKLKLNFEGITNSQISGLIRRLSKGKSTFLNSFSRIDQPNITFYSINPEWENQEDIINNKDNMKEFTKDDLIVLSNEILEKSVLQLNNLKIKINNSDDFIWLQNKIKEIENLITDD